MDLAPSPLCLCFPCILTYLGGYIYPVAEHQAYPILATKGFSAEDQLAIAEEWYWVAVERETAIKDYLAGHVTFRDGCWWRPPPAASLSTPSTPASSSSLVTATSNSHNPMSSQPSSVFRLISIECLLTTDG